MCGIFGYVGSETDAATLVHRGLKSLEYRGYDSWGIAVGAAGTVQEVRDVGKLNGAPEGLPLSGVAIGHTRWATTGPVTTENAHPHTDCQGRLALVHNGIIENYRTLREALIERGHVFRSETDSEVAAHLLEEELGVAGDQPGALVEALRRVALQLDGLNAIVALDVRSGELAATKNGSPLVVGFGDDEQYLASDMASLLAHTRRLMIVEDGQVVSLRREGVHAYEASTGHELPLAIEDVQWRPEDAELGPYHHYLEKEIWEQPDLLRRIADDGLGAAEALAAQIVKARAVYLVACGTAYHAALLGRHMLRETGRAATAVYAHEIGSVEPLLRDGDLVIAFSQSGETIDVIDAVRAAKARGCTTAALANVPGSSLTRLVDHTLMLGAGPEKSVLSTKTYTAKVAYMALIAGLLRGTDVRDDLRAAATEIERLRGGDDLTRIRDVAHHIQDANDLFVLGREAGYPLALEAALKIKEVTYIHAEGVPAGELKHGTIALIEPGVPVLVFIPDGPEAAHLLTAAGEVKARGAYVIGIGPTPHDVLDAHIRVDGTGIVGMLVALPPVQLLAYELALLRGADPDKPRNLAKSVTVR